MNEFHFNGKVSRISKNDIEGGQGIYIIHFPDTISDSYFEFCLVFPDDLWNSSDIRLYDYLEVKGHYVILNKNEKPKKSKIIHVVDEILKQVHE